MRIKEINLNDMVAIGFAGAVVIVSVVFKVEEPIIPVITGFLGVIGGYVGSRLLNNIDEEEA